MRGLLVWAQSSCRSTMGLHRALGQVLGVNTHIALWHYKNANGATDIRAAVGFRGDEFSDVSVIPVGDNYEVGRRILDEHQGWHHLFCVYQGSPNFRRLLVEAKRRGDSVAVCCESPCNMFNGWRKIAKEVYFRTLLRVLSRSVVKSADMFVNCSGNDDIYAKIIGWSEEKIIPFGYFPPPIPGSRCVKRSTPTRLEILATGLITWHRGCDILIEALRILKQKRVCYHATVTQDGPLRSILQRKVEEHRLPVDFVGFMPLEELTHAYESCSVYVGAGRHEPWGMRLNDALNCGAPLVVSEGMGGVKMVKDYHCGLPFRNEDPVDLADKLYLLATDQGVYSSCAENAVIAAEACSPQNKAKELIDVWKARRWI